MKKTVILISLLLFSLFSCGRETDKPREDKATQLAINLYGSLQNPAFSPDGKKIVFTRFLKGYNKPPSYLYIYYLETNQLKPLVFQGKSNVNLPGSCWNDSTHSIVFSSERDGNNDQIFTIYEDSSLGTESQVTNQGDRVVFEPTFSPDGKWIVFESHEVDDEENGVIVKYKLDGSSGYINLTPKGDDCKQPNWSPTGDKILYQKEEDKQWDIWVMNSDGSNKSKVTDFPGNKTDAVFTHDGKAIIFSSENDDVRLANIYKYDLETRELSRLTYYDGYDGAASISPNGDKLVFESTKGNPERSDGATLWILDL